jgi:hypothetical protein
MVDILSRLAAHGSACLGLFADAAKEIAQLRAKVKELEENPISSSKYGDRSSSDQSLIKEKLIASVPEHSIWRHHSGRIYRVLFLTNTAGDGVRYPYEVVYKGPGGRRWTGRLDDWHRRMTRIEDSILTE